MRAMAGAEQAAVLTLEFLGLEEDPQAVIVVQEQEMALEVGKELQYFEVKLGTKARRQQ